MAFDPNTRNRLQGFVKDARDLLTEEFTRQLRGVYRMDPETGRCADLDGLTDLDNSQRETAREEAWEVEGEAGEAALARAEGLVPLRRAYESKGAFLRDVPRLIVERNIHGIDIDARAVQIAGLSLWLRAQKSWHARKVRPQDRPVIRRSNVVCAEPMPGEKGMLEEFLATLQEDRLEALIRQVARVPEGRRVRATRNMADRLCDLVRVVWDRMRLAGEAGSLPKIEGELQEAPASTITSSRSSNRSPMRPPAFVRGSAAPLPRRSGWNS
jgi:hypothetical protein